MDRTIDQPIEPSFDRNVRRLPMCYLDVSYAVGAAPRRGPPPAAARVFRCLYPIYGFDDFIVYLSRCPAQPKPGRLVASAILTLRAALTICSSVTATPTPWRPVVWGGRGAWVFELHDSRQFKRGGRSLNQPTQHLPQPEPY
jgi:hypothetical protein